MDQLANAPKKESETEVAEAKKPLEAKPKIQPDSEVEQVDSKCGAQGGATDLAQDLSKAYSTLGISECSTSSGLAGGRSTPATELKKNCFWKDFQLKQVAKKPDASNQKPWGRPLREGIDYYYDQRKFFLTSDDDDDCYTEIRKPFRISDSDSD